MRPSSRPTKNSRVRLARYRQPCLLVVVIGVALDMVSFIGLRRIEYQNARVAFENVARERLDQMEAHLALTLHSLTALGAFYDGAKVIGREDFRRFANSVLTRDGAVDALEWAPRVPQRLRAAYVSSAGNSGLAAFEITERSADGRLVIAGERAEYFPVERVEPLRGNEKAIGFDLASNPTRRRALERSVATGQLSATSRILVQETHDQYGMLVFRPVYRSGSPPAGVAARREALVGLVLGVIRLRDLVEKVGPSATASADLRVAVFDRSAAPPEQLLYPKRAPFGATENHPEGFRVTRTVRVAGRIWEFAVYPGSGVFRPVRWSSWSALFAGLLLTILLAAYLRLILHRRAAIQKTVLERTDALHRMFTFSVRSSPALSRC